MRQLLEEHEGDEIDSTDGMKISWDKNRWVLILPDQDEPVFHMYAEGRDEEDCRESLDRYEAEIRKFSP
jgi:mannose-1-phosphate guanylyltransferase/phosphomannomutase